VASLPGSVQLMPGKKKEESFTLQAPRSPQSRAGPYLVTLRVSSLKDSTQFEDVKFTLKVSPYSQFNAEVYPPRLRIGQVARFTINNQGNQQETYKVKFNDLSAELAFRPPEFTVTVPEGGSATQEFRAELLQPKWLGGETTHAYKAQVSPSEGEPQTLQADVISRAYLPTWVPPTIVPLCLLLAGGLIWLLSQIPGAPLPGSLTATPTVTITQILSDTPTLTPTATPTATFTPTFIPTSSATSTPTSSPTNTSTNTATHTATYTPSPTPTNAPLPLDLHARAREATWFSGAGTLPFGGPGNDNRGFVMYQDGIQLEDGSNPSKVLEMHPQWVNDGYIYGFYPAYTVEVEAHFRARIGFIARADGICGDRTVKFQLSYKEGTDVPRLLDEWVEACEGFLSTLDVDLSSLAGRNVQFVLAVLANGGSGQDWAVWVNPRIEY
jgi:hypothetical protein